MDVIQNQLGQATTYTFLSTGETESRRFPNGDRTTYTYDAVGRLVTTVYADGTRVTFGYDATGNRTTMVDSTGTTTYAYDNLGRLIDKTDPGSLRLQYSYDLASQRTKLIDPDGLVRTFTYDLDGRPALRIMNGRTTTLAYDAAGRETTVIHGGGGVTEWTTYDEVGNALTMNTQGGDTNRTTFTYDPNGNPLTWIDIKGFVNTYAYDALDRLTTNVYSGPWSGTSTFAYDSVGNRIYASDQGPTDIAFDLAGRVITMSREGNIVTHTYDTNGNLTFVSGKLQNANPGTVTMSYDKENRMVSHNLSGNLVTYTYDGDGLKRSEISSTGRTTLVWDGTDYLQERK